MTPARFVLLVAASIALVVFAPLALAQPPRQNQRSFTDVIPCSACHNTSAWRAKDASEEAKQHPRFDHSTTGFPLTGQHIHAPCVACHNATREIKRACVSCHEDFHRGLL